MKQEWDLNSLYTGFNSASFIADSAALLRLSRKLNGFEPALSETSDPEGVICAYLEVLESFEGLYQKLLSYAAFRFSADTGDEEPARSMTRFRNIYASTARVRAAFGGFLAGPAVRPLVERGTFGTGTYYLREQIARQSHTLTPAGESALSALGLTGSQAWTALHAKTVASDLRPADTACIAAAALNSIKGEALTVCGLRGYDSPLQEALCQYHFDPRILERQMEAVEKYLPRLRDYYRLKARYFGCGDGLPYDRREELMLHTDQVFSYDEARAIILDAFRTFSPRMGRFGEAFFEKGWIDSEPRPMKEVGASCDAVWLAAESRIRMHYRNSAGDANALAHELGHGYHFFNLFGQRIINCRYDLPVAETASKFSELLFKEQLRTVLPGRELFCEEFLLSGCINTIVDITARFRFESAFFERRKNGELSVEEIDGLMYEAQRSSYGDGLDPRRLDPRAWVAKPHYYNAQRNFYNFPYQFGTLLSIRMLERWKAEPAAFCADYDRFLASTGQYSVLELCRLLAMDLLEPGFFEEALRWLVGRLDVLLGQLELPAR